MAVVIAPASSSAPDTVWFTRCPVPTASGLAYRQGWLTEPFAARGIAVGVLQDAPLEIAQHHYDHRLVGLIREGGNVPALVARSEGAPTRLVGLTWIDEGQSIIVRPDSGIDGSAGLRGSRIAVPQWAQSRDKSMARAMALHGFAGALALAGLDLDDVTAVEIPLAPVVAPGRIRAARNDPRWSELDALVEGRVDAVYVKGAAALEAARERGATVAIDLDASADRRFRVNNGTPRPITVHEQLLAEHPDLIVDFLAQTLRAADWACDNLETVRSVLAEETGSGDDGVIAAYRQGFHRELHPALGSDRLGLLRRQTDFLLAQGFLATDVDIDEWVAAEPLDAARRQLAAQTLPATAS